tara:strand:- start:300 stop:572 length:273 start_codon:yes stop_codon:yes gene_type:complete
VPISVNNFKFATDIFNSGYVKIHMMNINMPITIPIVNGDFLCNELNFGKDEVTVTHIVYYTEGGVEIGKWDWRDGRCQILKQLGLHLDHG